MVLAESTPCLLRCWRCTCMGRPAAKLAAAPQCIIITLRGSAHHLHLCPRPAVLGCLPACPAATLWPDQPPTRLGMAGSSCTAYTPGSSTCHLAQAVGVPLSESFPCSCPGMPVAGGAWLMYCWAPEAKPPREARMVHATSLLLSSNSIPPSGPLGSASRGSQASCTRSRCALLSTEHALE